MKLYIKNIIIEKNGRITQRYNFSDNLNIIPNNAVVYNIIEALLGIQRLKTYSYDIRFFAKVELDSIYFIRGRKDKEKSMFTISVCKENEETDFFEEYYNLIFLNSEIDGAIFFHRFKKQDFPHKLFKYRDLLKYYPNGDFSVLTNGYGTTRSFRAFMTDYIKHFKPIRLMVNKDLFLKLSNDGEFNAGFINSNDKFFLSESENVLYHYLSFISIADFWSRAEKIRNLNHVNKPLIVSNFLELLDESINLSEIVRHTNKTDRQVIMFSEKPVNGTMISNQIKELVG